MTMPVLDESLVRAACARPGASLQFASRPNVRSAQPALSSEQILAEIQRVAELSLAEATTLPPQAYTSQDFFDWEVEHLFRNDWVPLAHLSQLPAPGDFLNVDMLGEPLMVVHGKDGHVRALSRVCPHRAMDIMPEGFGHAADRKGCGHAHVFTCPYHAWSFDLSGRLKGAPEMQQSAGFEKSEWGLREFRCETWSGFVFVNFDGQAAPLVKRLGELSATLAPWQLDTMQLAIQMDWECPFNWKVLAENFMESYHHLAAHSKTLQPSMPARDTWNDRERPGYIQAHLPIKDSVASLMKTAECPEGFPVVPGLPDELRCKWQLFLVHPLMLLAVTQDRIIWYRMQPLGPDQMTLLTTTLVPPSTMEHPSWPEMLKEQTETLRAFHLEDMEMCTAVQRGFYSSGYQRGRLSYLEMSVWLIQRYLAARARGVLPGTDSAPAPSQRP